MSLGRLTPFDVVVITIIILLAVTIIWHNSLSQGRRSADVEAGIYQDGKLLQQVTLTKDQEIRLYDGKMLIEIKDKKLRVKQSQCPRQVCVHVGWIRSKGETIICVPYHTVIELKSAGAGVVDAVVF